MSAMFGSNLSRQLKISIGLLVLLCVGLLIGLIIVASKSTDSDSNGGTDGQDCNTDAPERHENPANEPENPPVFHDLTTKEIQSLKHYLYEESNLHLVKPSASKRNASYVFLAEIHVPNKSEVLNHLDNNGPQPPREARVIIIKGTSPNEEINELVVGPLPKPTYHKPIPGINASLPYFYRPMTEEDYGSVTDSVTNQVNDKIGSVIYSCYGAKLKDCGRECLSFLYASSFSPASSGVRERKTWYWLTYDVEYYTLHPVNFAILANIKTTGVTIDTVWFQGQKFDSLDAAVAAYRGNNSICQPQTFPKNDRLFFSTLNKRGMSPPLSDKRSPIFVEPDGKRYTVNGKHVNYMKWTFDFRMSTAYGPQIYDVRFDNERIVYELGLQEISVFYSGNSPQQRFSDYMDSAELIGPSAQGLIPGVDCPSHASYYDTVHVTETSETPDVVKNVFCLFELNTGEPLRRHHSYFKSEGSFFEGLENVVLVLRTAMTIVNYDYILDFRFFQNGVMETKAMSTGYVLANAVTELEKQYGFQLHDKITANFHTHFFNLKIDLDIGGTRNRYEVIHIEPETIDNVFSKEPNATYSQGKLRHDLKTHEQDAAYKFNFDRPKYHTFYNNGSRDNYGNPKAYRLLHTGMVKQILPEGHNKEVGISWARYQFAVTKHKDHEAHSSSLYSMFDTLNPVVNFQDFINDNENIVDEDLVLWLTLGVHHIPHTEDLPVTPTSGMGLSFYLLPYNYFTEDPSMASPNAVRIEPGTNGKIHVERYGMSTDSKQQCIPPKSDFDEYVNKDKSVILEQ